MHTCTHTQTHTHTHTTHTQQHAAQNTRVVPTTSLAILRAPATIYSCVFEHISILQCHHSHRGRGRSGYRPSAARDGVRRSPLQWTSGRTDPRVNIGEKHLPLILEQNPKKPREGGATRKAGGGATEGSHLRSINHAVANPRGHECGGAGCDPASRATSWSGSRQCIQSYFIVVREKARQRGACECACIEDKKHAQKRPHMEVICRHPLQENNF
jgi:hypothetical protein